MRTIYAVRDRVANALAGNEQFCTFLYRNDQQAIRYFGDALATEKTLLHQHPQDFELIACGSIKDDGGIELNPEVRVVITGEALTAAQHKDDNA